MKKVPSIIIAAVMAACVPSVFAQGTVVFNNGTGLVWQMNFAGGPPLIPIPKGGGMVQMFWAPTGSAYVPWTGSLSGSAWQLLNPMWKLENPVGFTTPTAGKFSGGTLVLNPLGAGAGIDYVVLGWTGTATSFDAALASSALANVSAKFSSTTGNPTTVPPGTATPIADSFGGLILSIPEPSSFGLAGLAAATLLAFRRSK